MTTVKAKRGSLVLPLASVVVAWSCAGCGGGNHHADGGADLAVPHDGGSRDGGVHDSGVLGGNRDLAGLPDGGTLGSGGGAYHSPGSDDEPLAHATPTPLSVTVLAGPADIYDVGADQGGGIWAVTSAEVSYWPAPFVGDGSGGGTRYTYTQADGLARKDTSFPFASIAGGVRGEAFVGSRGAIADHFVVNPQGGAVVRVENMVVPYSTDWEYPEHLARVTAGLRAVVAFDGTWNGTAYIGGVHGFVAWHGVDGGFSGSAQFEEHQHYIPDNADQCDSTGPSGGCWGGDTKGLAISPEGDVWAGDEHFVALLPQRSLGVYADFFEPFALGIDVFPGANDEVAALATDPAGGVWVASFGQGLAYLQPMTHLPVYFDRERELPQNRLAAVVVDEDNSVWVGSFYGGLARYDGRAWRYYTQASGLPSDEIRALFIDRSATPRRLLIATSAGVAVYDGK